MNIRIYGAEKCKNCQKLKKRIEEIVKEEQKGDEIEIQKINDLTEIAEKGIMSTPAVSINDEFKIKGSAPSKKELKEIIFSDK